MKCINKEQEQEFISEILRIIKEQGENPTYDDLSVAVHDKCIELNLYKYIDINSRRYMLCVAINNNIVRLNSWGNIDIEIDETQTIEFHYLINILKNKYIEKVLNELKSK